MEYPEVPGRFLERMSAICTALPEVIEEPAWSGRRWRVRKKTFAHVVTVEDNSSPAFARAVGTTDAVTVVVFRSQGDELVALRNSPHPFFAPGWGSNVCGIVLEADTDWDEVAELMADSYCVQAPKKLAALVDQRF